MTFWTLDRVAEALGGGPRGARTLTAVSTDTRNIPPGALFVALRGERFDAHDFLAQAVEQGAAAVVVHDAVRASGLGVPVYEVPDTLVALGALARYRRRAWGRPVIAVAGSNGKTSTKDLLRAALGSALAVHATTGNLNNRVGLPLTLLALPDDADIAVIEAGTNEPGEVAILRAICEPDVAVVTSIGEEHLEGLGDLEGVLREESAIFEGTPLAVTPADQPEIGAAARRLGARTVVAGLDDGDVRADRWGLEPDGTGWIEIAGTVVRPPLRGAHNLRNTMLALAVCRECAVSMDDAARGIAAMPLPAMRVSWESLGQATLINDAYNANPPSMRAALDLLRSTDAGRQRVAVLGSMRELGDHAPRLHREIAALALDTGCDVVAGVGDFAIALDELAPGDDRVVSAADVEALWPLLEPRLTPDAIILLKASRGMKLERLVPHLTAWASR